MPLLAQGDTKGKGKPGIWHITESTQDLLKEKSFSDRDLLQLDTFSHEQRKKEWLAARILTEKLTGNPEARIVYDEHNKPSLQGSEYHISISHSRDLLAVILSTHPTGIDIELIKPKIERIKHKFMSTAELGSLQSDHFSHQLTAYWCAKESLYKLYGQKELSFRENLIIEPFQYSEAGILKGWIKNAAVNKCYSLRYEKLSCGKDDYMMAYVI